MNNLTFVETQDNMKEEIKNYVRNLTDEQLKEAVQLIALEVAVAAEEEIQRRKI